ncbi:COPI associated protein-domain-containing protein [Blakeslea trispora]|nr:COPI associated protein-domain-containing protein [Blakeslea trispora]
MISRSKVEHILCLTFNAINIILYAFVIVAIIFKCINGNFADIVMGIYGIVMAALMVVNELQAFEFSYHYFHFLSTYRGRGFLMVFFGCLVLDSGIVNIVVGTLALATGLFYIILSFTSNFPPPNPITINWRNWIDFSAEGLDLPHHRGANDTVVSEMHERLKSPAPIAQHHAVRLGDMIDPEKQPMMHHPYNRR